MIILSPQHLKQITDEAEAAYPNECCGLLVGTGNIHATLCVTRVVPSPNVTEHHQQDNFEIDPQVLFDTMRALENNNEEIIGHYHSHPDHPALPSEKDLSMVYEPELAWLITSVSKGQALMTNAFRPKPDASSFESLEIRGTDWHELPTRDPQES
jgi:proteasome lid subunit RPN8/RPN11